MKGAPARPDHSDNSKKFTHRRYAGYFCAGPAAPASFPGRLDRFIPGIADGRPAALFIPAVVTDSSDGHIAHLRGLNLSRAWCWRRLAEALPPSDPRAEVCARAGRVHAEASLSYVAGDDYMVEHWLAAYAVLLFS